MIQLFFNVQCCKFKINIIIQVLIKNIVYTHLLNTKYILCKLHLILLIFFINSAIHIKYNQ